MALTYGKPQNWVEDMYSMKGDTSGTASTANFHGTDMGANTAQYPQEVIISCPNKMGRVRASIGGPIQLNVQSQWEPMFGGGIASMANGILGAANQLVEWGLGCTIQQPWMNRKNYKNTMPFTFTLPLNFIAIESARDDVVKPCLALVSFCYPRKYDPSDNENIKKYEQYNSQAHSSTLRPKEWFGNSDARLEGYSAKNYLQEFGANNAFSMLGKAAQTITGGDDSSVANTFLDLFEVWEIPGPSLLTADNSKSSHKGDVIDIIVGKMFNLGNCYLESVDINFGSSFDKNGYPLSAKVNVKCTCADSVVCSSTGNLLVNQFVDQSQKLGAFMNAASTTASNLVSNVMNIFNLYKGYYSGGLQIQEKTNG